MIFVIAAVSENGVIGNKGRIPWNIPEDMAHFKSLTSKHAIVMGRKTFESIGKPLPDRLNIIVSRTIKAVEGAYVVSDFSEAVKAACSMGYEDVFVCGGEKIYEEALPLAHGIFLTKVSAEYEGDAFFPSINEADFTVTDREDFTGDPSFSFITLKRK